MKVVKLLSTFLPLEWKRFGRFLRSPYYNSNQQIVLLYELLKKAIPSSGKRQWTQGKLYQKIYGSEPFKADKFQNLCSDLYDLATEFMVVTYLEKERFKKRKLVVEALSERNFELFKKASQQFIKEVKKQDKLLGEADFLLLANLYDDLYHHPEWVNPKNDQSYFVESAQNLSAFYSNKTMQLIAENRGNRNFLNIEALDFKTTEYRLKELFELAATMHQEKEMEVYVALRDEVINIWSQLKKKHQTDLLIHLINFSITNKRIQKEFGFRETFALYQRALEHDLLVVHGKMRGSEFLNISMLGFKLESEDWMKRFIRTYQKYLSEEDQQFLIPLINANCALVQLDYDTVIDLLSDLITIPNWLYLDKIKKLLIRAYFEGLLKGKIDHYSLLMYQLEAFKKVLKRNKILAPFKKEATYNFLELTKKLASILAKNTPSSIELDKFENQLDATQPLILAEWLKEKTIQARGKSKFKM
ncbi:MAG: hypothetical protein AAF960_23315 [Bacteroidota bacterium]